MDFKGLNFRRLPLNIQMQVIFSRAFSVPMGLIMHQILHSLMLTLKDLVQAEAQELPFTDMQVQNQRIELLISQDLILPVTLTHTPNILTPELPIQHTQATQILHQQAQLPLKTKSYPHKDKHSKKYNMLPNNLGKSIL